MFMPHKEKLAQYIKHFYSKTSTFSQFPAEKIKYFYATWYFVCNKTISLDWIILSCGIRGDLNVHLRSLRGFQ